MILLTTYMTELIELLKQTFSHRLRYVGLQGSYLRGEADENSDIDIMVVLDQLSVPDMNAYRTLLEKLGYRDKACGFICGEAELATWNPCEISQLLHTTRDYYGQLSLLVPKYTKYDEVVYLKTSLNNLYHELCHSYIHGKKEVLYTQLPHLYKIVFFILQNLHLQRTGDFILTKQALLPLLSEEEQWLLQTANKIKTAASFDVEEAFLRLFSWCQKTMQAKSFS